MNPDLHTAALVLIMALVTWLLRFLPFLVSGKTRLGISSIWEKCFRWRS